MKTVGTFCSLWRRRAVLLGTMALWNTRASVVVAQQQQQEERNSSMVDTDDTFLTNETSSRDNTSTTIENALDFEELAEEQRSICGGIIDMHLHTSTWFSTATELLTELDRALVDAGILYAVYPPGNPLLPSINDPNTEVLRYAQEATAAGRTIVGFASLNTTGGDENWETVHRDVELNRLASHLELPEFVGAKLAPPHTCLPLTGPILADIVQVVNASSMDNNKKGVLAIHVGTTPFCGPLGASIGLQACCGPEYVSPLLLSSLVQEYPHVTFILLHAGHDFLTPDDVNYYNGTMVTEAIQLAQTYSNVYLEISAIFAQDDESGAWRYPGGYELVQQIANANLKDRVIWGSDANHVQGKMIKALAHSIQAMTDAGFTQEELCHSLVDLSRQIFQMELVQVPTTTTTSTGGATGDTEEDDSSTTDRSSTSAAAASSFFSHSFVWTTLMLIAMKTTTSLFL